MERDDFSKVVQKDVNNYIGIKTDGKLKTKGGYVKLYKGGDFKSNSLQIIHKAVVDYLIKGIPPEDTIKQADNIFAFQQIMKTGGSYSGAYHYVNGKRMEIQKVNRVYAVKNECYGQIVKGKWITEKRTKDKTTGKMVSTPVDPPTWQESVIPECPEHAYIDNTNRLPIDDLDLDYYITMAKDRIEKYTTIDRKIENELKKITEVITIMATTKTTTATATDVSTWNVHKKLAEARLRFSQAPVKKSGVNHFAEFKFFELTDIVPVATEIFSDLGLLFLVTFEPDKAIGTMYNTDNPEDCLTFTSPTTELVMSDKNGADIRPAKMNSIQALGAVETYQRRYLYMTALDVVENDVIDATSGKEKPATTTKKTTKPATETEREEIKTELIDKDGAATETQIKAIKNGLKKLRTKDSEQHEPYITATIKAIKAGLTKVAADDLLIEIGKKIEG
jgi:hypothetical protein